MPDPDPPDRFEGDAGRLARPDRRGYSHLPTAHFPIPRLFKAPIFKAAHCGKASRFVQPLISCDHKLGVVVPSRCCKNFVNEKPNSRKRDGT